MDLTNQYLVLNPRLYEEPFIVKCNEGSRKKSFISALFLKKESTSRVERATILRLATKEEIESNEIEQSSLNLLLEQVYKEINLLIVQIDDFTSKAKAILKSSKKVSDLVNYINNDLPLEPKEKNFELSEEEKGTIIEILSDRPMTYRKLHQLLIASQNGYFSVSIYLDDFLDLGDSKNGFRKAERLIDKLAHDLKPFLVSIKNADV